MESGKTRGGGLIDGSSDKQNDALESGLPVGWRICGRAAIRAKDGSIVFPAPGMVRSPRTAPGLRIVSTGVVS
jgi:hypothetical protein